MLEQVRMLDPTAFAATKWIDRQRLMYLLIFGAMTIVAAVALLVAALGIANTRTCEVGIMKAVGAGVQLIFLAEGALISLVGGLLLGSVASIPGDRWERSMVQCDMKIKLKEALFLFPPRLMLGCCLPYW